MRLVEGTSGTWETAKTHSIAGTRDHGIRQIRMKIATVNGGKTVCLNAGVRGDEKVWDEIQAWPAIAPIA